MLDPVGRVGTRVGLLLDDEPAVTTLALRQADGSLDPQFGNLGEVQIRTPRIESEAPRVQIVNSSPQEITLAAAIREAAELDLRGWVRNTEDGDVEVVAAGSASELAELRSSLRRGPRGARVDHLIEHHMDESEARDLDSFRVEGAW